MTSAALGDLLSGHARLMAGEGGVVIRAITADSRKVTPRTLFVAIPGTKADGTRFIPQAVAQGAAGILMEPVADLPAVPVPVAFSLNVRRSLALACARLWPRQPRVMAAVTGTAGKTSVAYFLRHIYGALGHRAAYLGTLGLVTPEGADYGGLTSPGPEDLHPLLHRLAGEGITHMAVEASSHGLDQHRLDGLTLAAGGFTNLGRDHLDYHPTVEAYYRAKLRLFTDLLPETATAVALTQAPYGALTLAWARARGLRTLPIGPGGAIDIASVAAAGAEQVVRLADGRALSIPLIGGFQADNALLAAGLAIATGEDREAVLATLSTLPGVPGRMERIGRDDDRLVFVDYAHKPEALAAVLDTVRAAIPGRLLVVFGCGGDRDRGKRPLMGQIASARADMVIVTDDNPRSETPAAIRAEILAAAPGAREIGDRGEAISTAIAMLKRGDALVVAGKGHETGQIVGDRTFPFSDAASVLAALER